MAQNYPKEAIPGTRSRMVTLDRPRDIARSHPMRKYYTMKALLISTVFAVAPLAGMVATPAGADVDIYVNVEPPAPRVEVIPAPRTGYVWAPGYWAYRDREHVWVTGHWVRARTGYQWNADRWERFGDRWIYRPGHWEQVSVR